MDILSEIELDDEVKEKLTANFEATMAARVAEATQGLKAKNDELLSEKKKVQLAMTEAEKRASQEAEEKLKAGNNYKQLYESQKAESEKYRSEVDSLQNSFKQNKISAEAAVIAATLTKDVARAELLREKLSQRITIVDGEIRVTDSKGQLTVSTLDELTATIKLAYPFLIDGSQANGGGATRSNGRADSGIKEISRTEFDSMSQQSRATFFKSGGKVIE
tara:strand:+ start:5381 stop:6040 length:660 start_codon:yes stop_codon:yes gene_type:complete